MELRAHFHVLSIFTILMYFYFFSPVYFKIAFSISFQNLKDLKIN